MTVAGLRDAEPFSASQYCVLGCGHVRGDGHGHVLGDVHIVGNRADGCHEGDIHD